jgi:hypothetical protein
MEIAAVGQNDVTLTMSHYGCELGASGDAATLPRGDDVIGGRRADGVLFII